MTTVNILGTSYEIKEVKISESDYMKSNELSGYCDLYQKEIFYADTSEREYFDDLNPEAQKRVRNEIIRHEVIHAFLGESGLKQSALPSNGAWSMNEEMIDYFACMWPKIQRSFEEVGCVG